LRRRTAGLEKPELVGCVELAMTQRSASRCVFATHPTYYLLTTCWRPGSVVGRQRPLGHYSPSRPMPPAGNWLRFSCSIPPLFVLSHSLPTANTMGKLALFWRFSITVVSASSISLAAGHCSHATGHLSRATRRYLPRPSPAGYCLTPTAELSRPKGTRSRRAGRLYSVCHRTRQFLQTNQSVSPPSPPLDRRPFSRGRRRSTPVARGVPA